MIIDETILKQEEKAAYSLRQIYSSYGYTQFKMSKFEEYDLYVKNKDFLVSDGIISFTDTNGRLKALKPDVTLSIINNSKDSDKIQKVYYNENVYRISGSTHTYKEIMQTGLECIGNIGCFEVAEVLTLAVKSLESIAKNACFELSHVGLIEAAFDELQLTDSLKKEVINCINSKNTDDLNALCVENGLSSEVARRLSVFTASYLNPKEALKAVKDTFVSVNAAKITDEFSSIIDILEAVNGSVKLIVDFSSIGGMSYYSGVVFKGYIDTIPDVVLSGGQYDKLMKKLGRSDKAIGFAVYLDALQRFDRAEKQYDVDTVIVYGDDILSALKKAEELTESGKTVYTCREISQSLRYREAIEI